MTDEIPELLKAHQVNLHGWGIAQGLEVSGTGSQLTVHPGVGVDRAGQLLSLAAAVQLPTGILGGQTVYVTLRLAGTPPTPTPQLQSRAEIDGDNGDFLVLALAEINQNGEVTGFKTEDDKYRRRMVGGRLEGLAIQRSEVVGGQVQAVRAGQLGPGQTGGLRLTVEAAGDSILLAPEGHGNFAGLEAHADSTHLYGALSVDQAVTLNGPLSLSGAATLRDTLRVNGATVLNGPLTVTGAAVLNNTLNIGGAATLNNTLTVAGAAALNSTLSVTGATNLNNALTVRGATTVNSTLSVTGAVTLNDGLSVAGAAALKNTLTVNGTTKLDNALTVTGTATLNNALAVMGNVGIGRTNPQSKLHILGNAGVLNLEGNDHAYMQWYPDGFAAGRKAWTGFGSAATKDFALANQISGGHIVLLTSQGHVGIGTISPQATLDVEGRILRRGRPFSYAGIVGHNGYVDPVWGTTDDWNIFVSPRFMGSDEPGSERDNALLKIECYATPSSDKTKWQITARYKYRFWSDRDGVWSTEGYSGMDAALANYILVPR